MSLIILKGRTNELTKILIVFNLEVLITACDRKKKKVVELRRNKDAEVRADVEMLSSGQELKC